MKDLIASILGGAITRAHTAGKLTTASATKRRKTPRMATPPAMWR
jgi:hypothetical protein